ncbi:MAG: deoxyguanosinetriphosphate triphosphohydrolase [Dehalococcoidia bacterium]|nr:deoxyguanosinetriphosphate triphosphohydrolase [Dehalococcoidia bacterium]MDD5493373.1 deoxyguanosinetriphosphate triphosphohydrolase [Dehalococcoidia bacterium]
MVELNVRRQLEQAEEHLSPFAAKSAASRGRQHAEKPCTLRTDFQRDRDRIIFCNAFRRLKHKTQVFIAPISDHYVTRLTHTLEVAQISRTISRALNLNEDLTEAIALGHDLGHTPFGHMGEQVLNELLPGGFKHYQQSLRVVDFLEKGGRGLNLTFEVRDGILNHSKGDLNILEEGWNNVATVEGEVVKIADMVAYINHDIEDAIRAGIIAQDDLPDSTTRVLGKTNSARINTLVTDIVNISTENMKRLNNNKPLISMSNSIIEPANELREFLFKRVYYPSLCYKDAVEAREIILLLFDYFVKNPRTMPPEYQLQNDTVERKVADYIAGMTDHYAILTAGKLSSKPVH